jgi:hypothetical protein
MAKLSPTPRLKIIAVAFVTASASIAAYTALQSVLSLSVILPLVLLYAGIELNTYPSICCFQTLAPSRNVVQYALDAILVVLYLLMAWNIGVTIVFTFLCGCMFVVAALKYAHMLGAVEYDKLLRDKIIVDLLGAFCAFLVLPLILVFPNPAILWAWAGAFWLAQYWIFVVRKLYRLPPVR